jgi:hypothetical protein
MIRWISAIEHWTAAVAIGVALLLIVQLAGMLVGFGSIAKSPRGTIEAFYQAAQDRDYQLAKELLDANGRHQVSVIGDAAWQALVDELSGNQTINEMYYGSTRNYGSNAVVGIINYHSDESANPRVEELVRESGHWRIMWEPGTRTFVKTVQNYEPWFGK